MSAYFVAAETIADAAYAIKHDVPGGLKPYDALSPVSLGQVLWQLNALAVYEANNEDLGALMGTIATYKQESRPDPSPDEWQRYKSLQCLIYQCAEGTVPDTDLYKAMEDAETRIAVRLTGVSDPQTAKNAANSHSYYDNASWGRG
ncbi:hypothetical protein [Rhizobium favelukesii]|uniref:Uncharacterized protein n=1 Tax=Rhizobium favelukesii TaxID=348824 RepID=W6RAK8_9HYPH|nr:hypothetical protein [Rhizobium favelukesii]MCS0459308.1 hypothetical protein [Rhizobium favelukesii]CDM57390.1 putative predicted protein [Rhizobium favelukesii]